MFTKFFSVKAVERGLGAVVVCATSVSMYSGEVARAREMERMEAENPGYKAVSEYRLVNGSYGYFELKLVPEMKEEFAPPQNGS